VVARTTKRIVDGGFGTYHGLHRWMDEHACKFFAQLLEYFELDPADGQTHAFINELRRHNAQYWQQKASRIVANLPEMMTFIPDDAVIDQRWLDAADLSNQEFVNAFAALQGVLVGAYLDIEFDAFAWGFPGKQTTEKNLQCRVSDVLVTLGCAANRHGSELEVLNEYFKGMTKNRRQIPALMTQLQSLGFEFENYSPRMALTERFKVRFPDNPHVINVLKAYCVRYEAAMCKCCPNCGEMRKTGGCPIQVMQRHALFSHRYLEASLQYNDNFQVEFDAFDDETGKIAVWLHDNAEQYGYTLCPGRTICGELLTFRPIETPNCGGCRRCLKFGKLPDTGNDGIGGPVRFMHYWLKNGVGVVNPSLDDVKAALADIATYQAKK